MEVLIKKFKGLMNWISEKKYIITMLVYSVLTMPTNIVFASDNNAEKIESIINIAVNVVGVVFVGIGVILAIYAVGQLILAFKNDDVNARSTAAQSLIIGLVLIIVPIVLKALDLGEFVSSQISNITSD